MVLMFYAKQHICIINYESYCGKDAILHFIQTIYPLFNHSIISVVYHFLQIEVLSI